MEQLTYVFFPFIKGGPVLFAFLSYKTFLKYYLVFYSNLGQGALGLLITALMATATVHLDYGS